MVQPKLASVWCSRPLWALLVSLFIVNVGFGIVVPILPFYALEVGATPPQIGLLLSSYALTQFVTAPLWGTLTDRIGARAVIAIGTAGLGVSLIAFGLADELWMLFAARLVGGALGTAAVPASLTSAGGVSKTEERGAAMAMMGAGMGAGFIVGPVLGGFLTIWGLATPFLVAAAISFIASAMAILVLPRYSSVAQKATKPATANQPPADRVLEPAQSTGWSTPTKLMIGFFLFAVLMASLGDSNRQATLALYSLGVFGVGGEGVGLMLTLMGTTYVLVQIAIVGRAVDRFSEAAVLFAGLALNAIGFAFLLLAVDFWTLTATVCMQGAGMACIQTSVLSMISKYAGERRGTLMGVRTGLENVSRVVGPIWGGRVYELNPTFPYISGSLIYVFCILVGLGVYVPRMLLGRSRAAL